MSSFVIRVVKHGSALHLEGARMEKFTYDASVAQQVEWLNEGAEEVEIVEAASREVSPASPTARLLRYAGLSFRQDKPA